MALTAFGARELEQFTREFELLFDAAEAEAMTSYYAADARLMAEGMQPIQGRAAIGQFWRVAIERAAAARARRRIRLFESSSSGDLGYALCTVTIQIPPANGAPGTTGTSIAVWDTTIWQRDPGGTWRIAVDISAPLPRQDHDQPA